MGLPGRSGRALDTARGVYFTTPQQREHSTEMEGARLGGQLGVGGGFWLVLFLFPHFLSQFSFISAVADHARFYPPQIK